MAKTDTRHHLTLSGRLHLILRLVAVTGLLAGAAAAPPLPRAARRLLTVRSAAVTGLLAGTAPGLCLQANAKTPPFEAFQSALQGQHGGGARTAAIVLALSAVVVVLGLIVEIGRLFAS